MTVPVIHVVDDDDDMRTSLARLLKAEGYEVRGYASSGEFLLARPMDAPGCVILDLQMPGPGGLELQHAISLPVVFLTGRGDIGTSVRAMKAGAVDFLEKPVEPAVLLEAVGAALERGRSSRARDEGVRHAQDCYRTLTERERSVFELVVAGKMNKHIGDSLGIAERTVKAHRAQVMSKMQAASVVDLVRIAGLLKS